MKNVKGMGFKEWVDRVAVSASFVAFQRCHLSFLIRCSCFVFVSASLGCLLGNLNCKIQHHFSSSVATTFSLSTL